MMKIIIFLLVLLIYTIIFTETPMAIPITVGYKQGIFSASEYHSINATAKLILLIVLQA